MYIYVYLFILFILLSLFCTVKSAIRPLSVSKTVQLLQNDAQK